MKIKFPPKIVVVFTESDLKNAGSYHDNENCIMATALKRMGYEFPLVGRWGEVSLYPNKDYSNSNPANYRFESELGYIDIVDKDGYNKDLIGLKLVLNQI